MKLCRHAALGLILITTACGQSKPSEGKAPPVPTGSATGSGTAAGSGTGTGAEPTQPAGLDLAGMNKAVKPGDDFFRYANGTWLDKTEIPADRASWGSGPITTERTYASRSSLRHASMSSVRATDRAISSLLSGGELVAARGVVTVLSS